MVRKAGVSREERQGMAYAVAIVVIVVVSCVVAAGVELWLLRAAGLIR